MDAGDRLINEPRAVAERQATPLGQQAARIAQLHLTLDKAKNHSTPPSRPPSSDMAKPKSKKTSGRCKRSRRDGQPGHEQPLRDPLPLERIDDTIDGKIDEDEQSGRTTASPRRDRLPSHPRRNGLPSPRTHEVGDCHLQKVEPPRLRLPCQFNNRPTPSRPLHS